MSAISSAAAAIANQNSASKTASNGAAANGAGGSVVQASFSDVLGQVQAVVTGRSRTGFNSSVTNSLTSHATALRVQTKSAIDSTLSAAKSLLSISPKTGGH